MPVNTSYGVFSTGVDISVDVTLPSGAPLVISNVTGWDRKMDASSLKSKGIDGVTRLAFLPESWSGSFDIDRANHSLDDFFAAVEANYYSGVTVQNVTITETIREGDGTISQYRYQGVALHYGDAGSWKGAEYVKQKVEFMASRRIKVQ